MLSRRTKEGSEVPEFTDVKMFVDSLLMEYQTNRSIQYELERNLMTCSPYRDDVLYSKSIGRQKERFSKMI